MHFARSRLPCQHLQRSPGLRTPCRHRAMLAVGSMRWRPQEATGSARQAPVQAGVTTAPAQMERVREVISQPQSPAIPLQFLDGEVVAGGALKVLQDVGSDVFVSMHGAESLVLGVATSDGAASMVDTAIGALRCNRYLAAARCKLWWMTPEWGSGAHDLTPETQFLLLELKEGGPYAIMLPLIDRDTFRGTLRPPGKDMTEDTIVLRMESGDDAVLGQRWEHALYMAAGSDPYALVESAVAGAAALSGGSKPLREKQLPPTLDVFGWCTWDAFYSRVSARGLHEGLGSLVSAGVPPRFLIIDDGWQCTDVDRRFRQPPTTRTVPRLSEIGNASDEFFDAELEVLSSAARKIPPSSSAGSALKGLTEDDMLEEHRKSGPRTKAKGKWLEQTIAETMVSMSEDLYDTEDDEAPFIIKNLLRRPSRESKGSKSVSGDSMDGAAAPKRRENGARPEAEATTLTRPPPKEVAAGDLKRAEEADPAEQTALTRAPSDLPAPVNVDRRPRFVRPILNLFAAIIQRLAGLSMGLIEMTLLKFYTYVVESAPHDSWPVFAFSKLANGPLKDMLLEFYAASGDFTRRLTSVKANSKFSAPDAGPEDYFSGRQEDLRSVVTSLRATFGVDYIYCWHGLPAYWSGISLEDPGTARYEGEMVYAKGTAGLYEIEPSMRWNPAVVAGVGMIQDPRPLYDDMHAYLAQSGITGVKVDCQAGVGMMGSRCGGGPLLAASFHAALEESIARHFPGNHCINCMAHSTENIYRWSETAVARASDDFYPRDPASFKPHIGACAYVGFFMSALVQPDWDMFQSKHPAAELHAAARVLSGGSIYVSDAPGQHDVALLRRLVLSDGTILRALRPGRPTRDTIFRDVLRDGTSLLKVWNVNRYSGIVGAFHLQGASWSRTRRQFLVHDETPQPLATQVRAADVELLSGSPEGHPVATAARRWAAFDGHTGALHQLKDSSDFVAVQLHAGEARIVTLAPFAEHRGVEVAPVGLTNMLNAGGAVLSFQLADERPRQLRGSSSSSSRSGSEDGTGASSNGSAPARGVVAHLVIRGNGHLLLAASDAPRRVLLDGVPVPYTHDGEAGSVYVELPSANKLTRDVALSF